MSLMLMGPTAMAQETATVDQMIQDAIALRREGRDADALALFESAYAMAARPRLSAEIGLAEYALGHWSEAYDHLTEALTNTTDPWISSHRAALEQAQGEVFEHLGELIVDGPVGTEVRVDGVLRTLSGHVYLSEGRRVVELRVGPVVRTHNLMVLAGERYPIELRVTTEQSDGPSEGDQSDGHTQTPSSGSNSGSQNVLGAVLMGSGALALGLGAASLVHSISVADTYNSGPQCVGPIGGPDPCAGLASDASLFGALSLGGFVLGAAGVTLGTVFLLQSSPQQESTQLSCAPSVLGLACEGRF